MKLFLPAALAALLTACTPSLATVTTCDAGQVLQSTASGGWACASAVTAGAGVTVTNSPAGPTVSVADGGVDVVALQAQVASLARTLSSLSSCAAGQLLSSTGDGGFACVTLGAGTTLADGGVIVVAPGSQSCPAGYTLTPDAANAAWVVCSKALGSGLTDQVVQVGSAWVDRYEISNCLSGSLGDASGNGTGVTAVACSVANQAPLNYITWFQAAAVCANAGKHLCSNEEWQVAVTGTPEGTGLLADGGASPDACNVSYVSGQTPLPTGSHKSCVSQYGAYDLVGNAAEYVSEWFPSGATWIDADAGPSYPVPWGAGYGQSITVNVNSSANSNAGSVNGLPGTMLRGGHVGGGEANGAFSLDLRFAPNASNPLVGARCCLER